MRYIFTATIGAEILGKILKWDKLLAKGTIISYGVLFVMIIIAFIRLIFAFLNQNFKYEYLSDITKYEMNLLDEILNKSGLLCQPHPNRVI